MKKIGFYLRKGGVGKTTMAVSCAFELSRKSLRTALIDCDTQGNSSTWLLSEADYELGDVLNKNKNVEETLKKVRENLYIIPTFGATESLRDYSETKLVNEFFAFDNLNESLEKLGFDIVIYDLSPSFSLLEKRIIKSLDEIIMVTQAEFFSIDGVEIFLKQIQSIREENKSNVKSDKVVINMINQSFSRHKSFLKALKDKNQNLEIYEIGQSSKIAESQMVSADIFEYDPENKMVKEIQNLAHSIMK